MELREAPEALSDCYLDRLEHISGFGFVACQAYLTATYGFLRINKAAALSHGPRHSSNQTVVAIINHAANYWKHRDEWALERDTHHKERVTEAFKDVGLSVDLDYPLGNILAKLTTPASPSFRPLLIMLEQWRDAIIEVSFPIGSMFLFGGKLGEKIEAFCKRNRVTPEKFFADTMTAACGTGKA